MTREFINVISTKRSGHHAFVRWLRQHRDTPTAFANNLVIGEPIRSRLLRLDRPPAPGKSAPDAVIFNYEGVTRLGLEVAWRLQRVADGRMVDLLFLRDPLNLCASLLHRKRLVRLDLVMILRQLFAERDWLEAYAEGAVPGLSLIGYNAWLTDAAYRQRVADRLGLRSSERVTAVTRHGGGSSFKDLASVGDDEARRLTTRWHGYREDSLFGVLLTHPRLLPWFEAALAGEIRDSFGADLADPDGLAHLRATARSRPRHPFIDRMIDSLADRQDLFHRIESGTSFEKKLGIARAHLAVLAGPSRRAGERAKQTV
ncbi:hypothetical protein KXR53_27845 [Inquilinus limosus]|uniref:hypothetical protein n=1 Tax=Inquilinus limosus TaxID=171674 RepID=UPI003F17CD43